MLKLPSRKLTEARRERRRDDMPLRGGHIDEPADSAVRFDDVHFAVIGLDRQKCVAGRREAVPRPIGLEIGGIRMRGRMRLDKLAEVYDRCDVTPRADTIDAVVRPGQAVRTSGARYERIQCAMQERDVRDAARITACRSRSLTRRKIAGDCIARARRNVYRRNAPGESAGIRSSRTRHLRAVAHSRTSAAETPFGNVEPPVGAELDPARTPPVRSLRR